MLTIDKMMQMDGLMAGNVVKMKSPTRPDVDEGLLVVAYAKM